MIKQVAHQVKRANGRCTLRVTAIFKIQRRSFLEATLREWILLGNRTRCIFTPV